MTTRHCPTRDEQITAEECAGIVCNATSDQLAACMECEHGKAKRGTSPLAATPRVEPTAKAEVPAPAAPPAALEQPPVEVRVQVAESVAPAEVAAAPAAEIPQIKTRQWTKGIAAQRLIQAAGKSLKVISGDLGCCKSYLSTMLRRIDEGRAVRSDLLDRICAHYHLDKSEILRGATHHQRPSRSPSQRGSRSHGRSRPLRGDSPWSRSSRICASGCPA